MPVNLRTYLALEATEALEEHSIADVISMEMSAIQDESTCNITINTERLEETGNHVSILIVPENETPFEDFHDSWLIIGLFFVILNLSLVAMYLSLKI